MSIVVPASSSNIRRVAPVGSAPAALFDGRPSRGSGDLVELIAGLGVGRLGQYRQLAQAPRRRRGAVGELVDAVAIARPVDGELSRRQRAEAFDHLLRVAVRVIAAMPAPRRQPGEGLVDAGDPRLLGAAGVAHQAAREQLGETLVQGLRQRLDEGRLDDVDVDHREVAVDSQARRGQEAAVPRHDVGLGHALPRPALLD